MNKPRFKFTPEVIDKMLPNEVFCFGSNTRGLHGAGAALLALTKFGALIHHPIGLMGQSYGIITKDLSQKDIFEPEYQKRIKSLIHSQLLVLYELASFRTDLHFLMTKIGCGLGGFATNEIAQIFLNLETNRPANVILPVEFSF